MRLTHAALSAGVLLTAALPATAKMLSEKEMARAEAERACYLDAKTLCPDAIPSEEKVTACFSAKRSQLSAACGSIFDEGI